MVGKDLVMEVNQDLVALRDEAARHQDSPRFIRLLDNMVRLTNIDGEAGEEKKTLDPACKHPQIVDGACVACGGTIESLAPAKPATQHQCSPNVYGTNCIVCNRPMAAESSAAD